MGSNQLRLAVMIGLAFALHFPAAAAQGVVGRWQSPDSEVVIKADGTLTIDGTMFRYRIAGKVFTLIGADGELAMPFELAGDRMSVVINGRLVQLQRVVAGGPPRRRVKSAIWLGNGATCRTYRQRRARATKASPSTRTALPLTSSSGTYGGTASRRMGHGRSAPTRSSIRDPRPQHRAAKRNHQETIVS
jgi:hypothetical protein